MPTHKPLKTDPSRHDIEYDYRELERLASIAREIKLFGRMMKDRAKTPRPWIFWKEEIACMTRIYSFMAQPLEDFFSTVMRANGDIAVRRDHDPAHAGREGMPEDGVVVQFPKGGRA